MTTLPADSPAPATPPPPARISLAAALLAGLAAIGACALTQTLLANAALHIALRRGTMLPSLQAAAASGPVSWLTAAALALQVLAGLAGGCIAARLAPHRPLAHAALAGVVYLGFFVVMLLAPAAPRPPAWLIAFTLAAPLVASLLGGLAMARLQRPAAASEAAASEAPAETEAA